MHNITSTHIAVSTDIVIFTLIEKQLHVLLVQRTWSPFDGSWSLPGGFVESDEDLETSAWKRLAAETSLTGVYLEQLYTFGNFNRDPRTRVISVAYYALIPSDRLNALPPSHSDRVGWFPFDDLPKLALDHDLIISKAHERLASKLDYSTIALQFMAKEFTLRELQEVYEAILRASLDKRNFRKWILSIAGIEETGKMRRNGAHRPAKLYRVTKPGQVEFIR